MNEVTKSYRWDATVRSYIIASLQGHTPSSLKARKMKSAHLGGGEFRCLVTATEKQHEAIKAAVQVAK